MAHSATGTDEAEPLTTRPFVLIVDDFDDNRALYASFFSDEGYRTAEASNGADAVAVVAVEKPDVVIMDLSMPVMDGWEATRLIKSNPRTKDVVIIVLTGFTAPDERQRALAAGADDFCTKPCDPRSLHALVRKHVKRAA
jgi:two-component system, cell cycle response regulator DivK